MPFTEVIASQLIPSAEDVTSSCELGIIAIELSIHSFEIMAWHVLVFMPVPSETFAARGKKGDVCARALLNNYMRQDREAEQARTSTMMLSILLDL